jgi:hypothetical protein
MAARACAPFISDSRSFAYHAPKYILVLEKIRKKLIDSVPQLEGLAVIRQVEPGRRV